LYGLHAHRRALGEVDPRWEDDSTFLDFSYIAYMRSVFLRNAPCALGSSVLLSTEAYHEMTVIGLMSLIHASLRKVRNALPALVRPRIVEPVT
jgi:hypothetical protein